MFFHLNYTNIEALEIIIVVCFLHLNVNTLKCFKRENKVFVVYVKKPAKIRLLNFYLTTYSQIHIGHNIFWQISNY